MIERPFNSAVGTFPKRQIAPKAYIAFGGLWSALL
jgi:hypothetical protein